MQRTLVMIRHAKSSWAGEGVTDFDRPLNDRGEHDAPEMGLRLKKLGILPDVIISSTAKRAKQTAKKIARGVDYEPDCIKWEEKLYHCPPSTFEEVIYAINDDIKTVFIVAHNPAITEFINALSAYKIDNMPTCGAVAIHVELTQWNQFHNAKKNIFLFEYPKKES